MGIQDDGDKESMREEILFGMGCFWGAERMFWKLEGVLETNVGYAGGGLINPTYREVCSGTTNHAEVVQVFFDPTVISVEALVRIFFTEHDPTQGDRQGNDIGSQYRSVIFTTTEQQRNIALEIRTKFEPVLMNAGFSRITTTIAQKQNFYLAEEYHQKYLLKVPNGYCGIGGTGFQPPA
jgi:peptide-methionine (S)-S-oxide reductase